SKSDVSQAGRTVSGREASSADSVPTQPATNVAPATASGTTKATEPTHPGPMWESLVDLRETAPLHPTPLDSSRQGNSGEARDQGPRTWPTAIANLTSRVPGPWWTIPGVFLLCSLIAWAAGVFKVKTKEGWIVLENVPENAVVEIDGSKIVVTPKEG